MKTDLKQVLSISGQSGLFLYLAQAKNGMIVESLATKNRSVFGANAKVTSLADISVYTNEDEMPLRQILENMHKKLGETDAPTSKSDANIIKGFFAEVAPNYDEDRFYVSHMKKILEWYKILKEYASLDFEDEKKEEEATAAAEQKSENKTKAAAPKKAPAKSPAKSTSTKAATSKAAASKKSTKSVQRKAN